MTHQPEEPGRFSPRSSDGRGFFLRTRKTPVCPPIPRLASPLLPACTRNRPLHTALHSHRDMAARPTVPSTIRFIPVWLAKRLRYATCPSKRKMTAFLIDKTMRLLALLPLWMNQAVGRLIGRIAWWTNSSARRITSINLSLCYPDMSRKERDVLARASLLHTGMLLTECAWILYRPSDTVNKFVADTVGQELLEAAFSSDRGSIFASPHIGNWELSNLIVSEQTELHYFYRSPRNKTLAPLLLKWRGGLGGIALELSANGIRDAIRVLKSGGAIGILPDQEPDMANGMFAPFMNTPVLTMTLLSRLAKKTNAEVLICFTERLPKARGWRLHVRRADEKIADADMSLATTALNRSIAHCVSAIPAQYLWDYKRFNALENGGRRNYKTAET